MHDKITMEKGRETKTLEFAMWLKNTSHHPVHPARASTYIPYVLIFLRIGNFGQ